MCDLNPLCTYWDFDRTETNRCSTYTDTKVSGGNNGFGYICEKKEDPPNLKFYREPGDCKRSDAAVLNALTSRGTVADVDECEAICQDFHSTCQGFSFET
jgi:hypothetical protein